MAQLLAQPTVDQPLFPESRPLAMMRAMETVLEELDTSRLGGFTDMDAWGIVIDIQEPDGESAVADGIGTQIPCLDIHFIGRILLVVQVLEQSHLPVLASILKVLQCTQRHVLTESIPPPHWGLGQGLWRSGL